MVGNADAKSVAARNGRALRHLTLLRPDIDEPHRRPLSVLYVEDDQDDVFLIQRHISRLPSFAAELVHAASLEEACRLVDQRHFDVVLCDFWLGSETTMPLVEILRDKAPVVLVSSLDNADIELIGRRAAVAGFVAKDDLSPAALDRVFTTLVPASETRDNPAAAWLKMLLRCIDRMQDVMQPVPGDVSDAGRALIEELQGSGNSLRDELATVLTSLQTGSSTLGEASRFNAVAYLSDAVRDLGTVSGIDYVEPAVPIIVETNASLFADVIQGFFAEAYAQVSAGIGVSVTPVVSDGYLNIEVQATGRIELSDRVAADDPRAAAAASTRRLLIETLAEAVGGHAFFVNGGDQECRGGLIGRLSLPLRPRVALDTIA